MYAIATIATMMYARGRMYIDAITTIPDMMYAREHARSDVSLYSSCVHHIWNRCYSVGGLQCGLRVGD